MVNFSLDAKGKGSVHQLDRGDGQWDRVGVVLGVGVGGLGDAPNLSPLPRWVFSGIRADGKFGELKGSLRKAEGHEGSLKQSFTATQGSEFPAQALLTKPLRPFRQDGRGPQGAGDLRSPTQSGQPEPFFIARGPVARDRGPAGGAGAEPARVTEPCREETRGTHRYKAVPASRPAPCSSGPPEDEWGWLANPESRIHSRWRRGQSDPWRGREAGTEPISCEDRTRGRIRAVFQIDWMGEEQLCSSSGQPRELLGECGPGRVGFCSEGRSRWGTLLWDGHGSCGAGTSGWTSGCLVSPPPRIGSRRARERVPSPAWAKWLRLSDGRRVLTASLPAWRCR